MTKTNSAGATIYDLNYLTDHIISLPDLWSLYGKRQKKYGTNINTFSINQHWNPLTLFDALADVRKEFNPVNLEDAFKTQEGQPVIIEALNQWKIKVKNLSENLNHDSSLTR